MVNTNCHWPHLTITMANFSMIHSVNFFAEQVYRVFLLILMLCWIGILFYSVHAIATSFRHGCCLFSSPRVHNVAAARKKLLDEKNNVHSGENNVEQVHNVKI